MNRKIVIDALNGVDNPSCKLTFFEIKIKGLSMLLCPFQIR